MIGGLAAAGLMGWFGVWCWLHGYGAGAVYFGLFAVVILLSAAHQTRRS